MLEMFGIGTPELIVMGAILLLLLGGTRLPKIARSFGEPAGELQKGFQEKKEKSHKRPDSK